MTGPAAGTEEGIMPITISRNSQAAAPAIQISQEQRDLLWETLLRAYIERHPEILIKKGGAKSDDLCNG